MKNFVSVLFAVCSISFGQSQVINFSDINFKNALINHTPVIDLNHNGNIEISEAHLATFISVDNKGIHNISELSNFINLQTFSCQNNSISTLNLSNLTHLSFAVAGSNNINSIILNNLPSLNTLYCENNALSSINLSQVPNLQWLVCNNNQLSALNISNLSYLNHLYCWNNYLTFLELTNSINLQYLYCQNNYIADLDLSNCQNIYSFYGNQNSLTHLNIKNNQLFSVNDNFSISDNPYLQSICCDTGEIPFINNYLNTNSMSGIFVTDNCSLGEVNYSKPVISFYPNPITKYLYIENLNHDSSINIYDNLGKLVLFKNYAAEKTIKIDLEFLATGLYFIKIVENTSYIIMKKIIKK